MPRGESYIDKKGQRWVSRSGLATILGLTSAGLTYGIKKKWVKGRFQGGVRWFPSPQSEENYRNNSSVQRERVENNPELLDATPDVEQKIVKPPTALHSANTNKARISAELLRLEYESRLGKLVPIEEVKKVWENMGETLKKSLLAIPDRVAPEFGGKNSHKLYRTLVNEINRSLVSLELKHDYANNVPGKRGPKPWRR